MSPTEHCDLNLSSLPSDVIRKIIEVRVESIDDMQLISPRWNAVASAVLQNRNKLPQIDLLVWSYRSWGVKLDTRHSARYHKYFGVNAVYFLPVNEGDRFENEIHSDRFLGSIEKDRYFLRCLTRHFNRCSSVRKLYVILDDRESMDTFTNAISGVTIVEMDGNIVSDKSVHQMIEIVRSNLVRRLCLSVYCIEDVKEAGAAFIDLARIVPFIELKWSRNRLLPGVYETYQAAWQDMTEWLGDNGCIATMADEHVKGYSLKMNVEGMKR